MSEHSDASQPARLRAVLDALYVDQGNAPPVPEPSPGVPVWEEGARRGILETLVRTMLAQATSRANSSRAYRQLVDAFGGDWDAVRRIHPDELAAVISVGGLSRQKAPRIQALLAGVWDDFGEYSLETLRSWAPQRARAYLARYRGVGPKTAAFTLMRAAGMDLFPLNGGILRLCRRLGFLTGAESDDQAHRRMAHWVPPGEGEAAHLAMVRHARRVCRKARPRCGQCAVRELCEAARDGCAVD